MSYYAREGAIKFSGPPSGPRRQARSDAEKGLQYSLQLFCRAMSQMTAMNDEIRAILRDHGRLSVDATTLGDDSDLYQAGMTSHASVNVMLALEGQFDVEFPDRMLKRGVFESIAAIRAAIEELTKGRS